MNSCNQRGEGTIGPKTKLIFVVDDEPLLAEMSEAIFHLEGYQTRLFFDPAVALAAMGEGHPKPHLLLTDYQMRPMNGMELIDECKRRQPSLKTILYSGKVGEDIARDHEVKPDRFLRKPFQPRALLELAGALLAEQAHPPAVA